MLNGTGTTPFAGETFSPRGQFTPGVTSQRHARLSAGCTLTDNWRASRAAVGGTRNQGDRSVKQGELY
jgi:hypothetical protein